MHIREYAGLFKPRPWTPPSPAMRRLCELQTIRAGTVASLTEWKNRRRSGIMDDLALSLAKTTIQHFTSQLEAVDQAVAGNNRQRRGAVRQTRLIGQRPAEWEKPAAGIVLAELPGPDILGSSAAVTAYAGLRSAATPVRNLGQPARADLQNWQCRAPYRLVHAALCGDALKTQRSLLWSIGSRLRAASRESRL